ncbi:hypothetical protein JMJ47_000960 [Methylocystis sp. MJC1]|nr:hypothetical protein [Methylocystis sp. MJC1]
MRIILGLLSGLIGMLAGWFGLAFLVITLAGPDRDGGVAMGAFFNIGPIGALIGFITGAWLFSRKGVVTQSATSPDARRSSAAAAPTQTRISRPFAVSVLVVAGGLAFWGWYELIRSPYLTHGFMTLELQFRLPAGMGLPQEATDVHVAVEEGRQHAGVMLGQGWRAHDGDRKAILATATLSLKTRQRVVRLELPGLPEQIWRLSLSSDPDPTPDYSPWRLPDNASPSKIEMSFRLSADR